MPFDREPVETTYSQVAKIAETVDRLAALKPNDEALQQASEAMRECRAKIEKIYVDTQMAVKEAVSSSNERQQESADARASEHPIRP